MEDQHFWDDAAESGKVLKEVKNLKDSIEKFNNLYRDYEDIGAMIEMAEEENDAVL